MAGATPTWEIPYPDGTDDLCDGYLFVQEMAERVDELLDVLDVDLAGVEVIPLARVTRTSQQYLEAGGFTATLTFQSVDFDTANLANLSTNASVLKVLPDQRLIAGGLGRWEDNGTNDGTLYTNIINYTSGGFIVDVAQRHNGTGTGMLMTMAGMATQGPLEDFIYMDLSSTGAHTELLVSPPTRMWIMKMSDA